MKSPPAQSLCDTLRRLLLCGTVTRGNEPNSTLPVSRRPCQVLGSNGHVLHPPSAVTPGRSPAAVGEGRRPAMLTGRIVPSESYPYFCAVSAPIFSITIAVDPPRAYTFPLAVTLWPAKGSNFSF